MHVSVAPAVLDQVVVRRSRRCWEQSSELGLFTAELSLNFHLFVLRQFLAEPEDHWARLASQ